MALFFVFGLGFGLPLFALSLAVRARQQAVAAWLAGHFKAMGRVAGALLVGVGIYDLAVNLPFLLLYLSL